MSVFARLLCLCLLLAGPRGAAAAGAGACNLNVALPPTATDSNRYHDDLLTTGQMVSQGAAYAVTLLSGQAVQSVELVWDLRHQGGPRPGSLQADFVVESRALPGAGAWTQVAAGSVNVSPLAADQLLTQDFPLAAPSGDRVFRVRILQLRVRRARLLLAELRLLRCRPTPTPSSTATATPSVTRTATPSVTRTATPSPSPSLTPLCPGGVWVPQGNLPLSGTNNCSSTVPPAQNEAAYFNVPAGTYRVRPLPGTCTVYDGNGTGGKVGASFHWGTVAGLPGARQLTELGGVGQLGAPGATTCPGVWQNGVNTVVTGTDKVTFGAGGGTLYFVIGDSQCWDNSARGVTVLVERLDCGTPTPSITPTASPTGTWSVTGSPTISNSPSATQTPSPSATATPSATPSPTQTASPTVTPLCAGAWIQQGIVPMSGTNNCSAVFPPAQAVAAYLAVPAGTYRVRPLPGTCTVYTGFGAGGMVGAGFRWGTAVGPLGGRVLTPLGAVAQQLGVAGANTCPGVWQGGPNTVVTGTDQVSFGAGGGTLYFVIGDSKCGDNSPVGVSALVERWACDTPTPSVTDTASPSASPTATPTATETASPSDTPSPTVTPQCPGAWVPQGNVPLSGTNNCSGVFPPAQAVAAYLAVPAGTYRVRPLPGTCTVYDGNGFGTKVGAGFRWGTAVGPVGARVLTAQGSVGQLPGVAGATTCPGVWQGGPNTVVTGTDQVSFGAGGGTLYFVIGDSQCGDNSPVGVTALVERLVCDTPTPSVTDTASPSGTASPSPTQQDSATPTVTLTPCTADGLCRFTLAQAYGAPGSGVDLGIQAGAVAQLPNGDVVVYDTNLTCLHRFSGAGADLGCMAIANVSPGGYIRGLHVSAAGLFYVVQDSQVSLVDPATGAVLAQAANLNGTWSATSDPAGNVYVGELNGGRILKFDANLNLLGASPAGFYSGWTGQPYTLAYDAVHGVLWVGTGELVMAVDPLGWGLLSSFRDLGVCQQQQRAQSIVAVDPAGNLYVAALSGSFIHRYASASLPGAQVYDAVIAGYPGTVTTHIVLGMAWTANGQLLVSNSGGTLGTQVLRFDPCVPPAPAAASVSAAGGLRDGLRAGLKTPARAQSLGFGPVPAGSGQPVCLDPSRERLLQADVYDLSGARVAHLGEGERCWDTQGKAAGIYLLLAQLEDEQGQRRVLRQKLALIPR